MDADNKHIHEPTSDNMLHMDKEIISTDNKHICINNIDNTSGQAISNDDNADELELSELVSFYKNNLKNLKIGHLNINSIRHKFQPLAQALNKGMLDILSIQESKLDNSFPMAQFSINGYKCYRKDVTCNCGGLLIYVRSDLPQRRLQELEMDYLNDDGRLETIVIEVMLNSEKWLLCSIYKQPKLKNTIFLTIMNDMLMKCSHHGKHIMIVGDLNVNFSNSEHCLKATIDLYGLKNIVRNATCRKGNKSSLLDVVLTNVPTRLQNVINFDIGLSDFHDIVCFATKIHVSKRTNRKIKYRSYKNFDPDQFEYELSLLPFNVSTIFQDVDDSYWVCEKLITDIIDEHAPVKTRFIRHNNVPYMNGELRRAINVRNMLRRKYFDVRNNVNWERYRKQRNLIVKLRKKSFNQYTKDKCTGQAGSKTFRKTVKPLMSDKMKNNDANVILNENNTILTDLHSVCNVFNEYFISMTMDIGIDDTIQPGDTVDYIRDMYENHPSVKVIKSMRNELNNFSFKHVSSENIQIKLQKLNIHKAAGFDNIPAKLFKLGASVLCCPLQSIINQSMY